jgi:hypothetical protein
LKRIDFIFFDAGGGHRSAATALSQVIEQQGRPWEVRMVNLQEVLDPLDLSRKFLRIRLQDLYNLLLKKRWTLGSPQLMRVMHAFIRLLDPAQVRLLCEFWPPRRPDLVVSLVPNFNRALARSVRQSLPRTPFVTILTDIADYPPHTWIEREEQYLICGSARAVEQARALGHPDHRIFRTSGMILHPRFYWRIDADRRAERRRLGLDPDLPTGLVMFGGEGSTVMYEIARRLGASALQLQLILICGHNERLAARLRGLQHRIPLFIEGFTREIPYYMHLSDFFIGKPGPGSISEALAMKLPVIVERNAWTLPQERYNADWIRENQLGLVVSSFRRVSGAVEELLRQENYERFRANAAAYDNRAVFEIPDILDRILTAGQKGSVPAT